QIWKDQSDLRRQYQVDSEIILVLLRKFLREQTGISSAAQMLFRTIQGSASIAVLFRDYDRLLLATNTGSLYHTNIASRNAFIFASERYILNRLILKHLPEFAKSAEIKKIEPGRGCLVDLHGGIAHEFSLIDSNLLVPYAFDSKNGVARTIVEREGILPRNHSDVSAQRIVGRRAPLDDETVQRVQAVARKYPHDSTWQSELRRCIRCVLPETMPFIYFDDQGVCNYCRTYCKIPYKGETPLRELVEPFRRTDGGPECVVGVSGGRDSLYALHYIKRVLGLNAVAYTY